MSTRTEGTVTSISWMPSEAIAGMTKVPAEYDDAGNPLTAGYLGGGHIGSTTMNLGFGSSTIAAVAMPDKQFEPELGYGWVRFVQSAGGRTGVPAPRTVRHPPFFLVLDEVIAVEVDLLLPEQGFPALPLLAQAMSPPHFPITPAELRGAWTFGTAELAASVGVEPAIEGTSLRLSATCHHEVAAMSCD